MNVRNEIVAAVVDGGVVVNVAIVSSEDAAMAAGWVVTDGAVGIGWVYDGATFTPPPASDPDPAVLRAAEVARLSAELAGLDAASVRALRAVAAGVATRGDVDKLQSIEARAATLRADLSAVSSV